MFGNVFKSSAQERIEFSRQWNHSAYPVSLIDSITTYQENVFNLYSKGKNVPMLVSADSLLFNAEIVDTLILIFHNDYVEVSNPHLEYIEVTTEAANVYVRSYSEQPFVCRATGISDDGRLIIDADTICTILLSDLQLTSKTGSAICLKQKQKANIIMAKGTTNILNDAPEYNLSDSTDTSNGCIYSKGSLSFSGAGILNVCGNYRHAIASSKNITIDEGNINILCTQKDGIHCDKYKQEGGCVKLHLVKDTTKGIKVKESFELKGGSIEGDASGNVTITDGETSYCTLIKSDGLFLMEGGDIHLKHTGKGGRCISVDGDFSIAGGLLDLECHGDGDSYINSANETDYYTPKCVTVDKSISVTGGNIHCLSTGLGGKGFVAGGSLFIGNEDEQELPLIRIETKGECIINNQDEDLRFGCPKGIKANDELHIYGGVISVSTTGMGGEGLECNGALYIHGGSLECNTFDDGINVGQSVQISGGQVYCCSIDNDGIDSNGSITISGGIVASVNQSKPNESFDSEAGQLYLLGGIVFGLGSNSVDIAASTFPCYSTPFNDSGEGNPSRGLILTDGKYVYIQRDGETIMALRNDNQAFRTYITIMSPSFIDDEELTISEGECPTDFYKSCFNDRLIFDGIPQSTILKTSIKVQTIKHNTYEPFN